VYLLSPGVRPLHECGVVSSNLLKMERRERPALPGSTPTKLVNDKSPYANPSKIFSGSSGSGGVSGGGSVHGHSTYITPPPPAPGYHRERDRDHQSGNKDTARDNSSVMSEISLSEKSIFTEKSTGTLKILKKTINTLPFELRESVGSTVDFVIQQNELTKSDLEHSKADVVLLRNEIKKKNTEIEQLKQHCDSFQRNNMDLENTLKDMQDNLDIRQRNLVKNRKFINRMAGTNRM
jgi:hypothetical protein